MLSSLWKEQFAARASGTFFGFLLAVALGSPVRLAASGFLHTRGQDMVDEQGQKVLLRGVGLGNWLLPEGYMWHFGNSADRPRRIEKLVSDLIGPEDAARFWIEFRQQYITHADIRRIAELGFNSVRPALNARLFLTEGDHPVFIEEGFALLDDLIAWCKQERVYVILDMHAAPGGQTGQNIDDSVDDQPALFRDKQNQDRLVDLWVKIASRYKDEPTVAAYDLLNEPLPERTGAEAKYKDQLEPLYRRLVTAIRQVDKKHMITLEGADWANDWSVFSNTFDDNLFYQFHYYCWDRTATLKSISHFLATRARLNAPAWVGETGESNETLYWGTTQYFERNNIGWSFWPWKKMDTRNTPYSIKSPEGWREIVAFSRGEPKPAKEPAKKTLDQFLQNIRLENCQFYPEVVNAIFRRVPARIEAENYDHDGTGKSYSIRGATQNAKYYRTSEAVPVVQLDSVGRRGGQAIRLSAEEWTSYSFTSLSAQPYQLKLRVKAVGGPAVVKLSLGSFTREMKVAETGWAELDTGTVSLPQGESHLKFAVTQGELEFDWASFTISQPAPSPGAVGSGPS